MSITEMRSKARRLALEHGLDLLIVDYIYLRGLRGKILLFSPWAQTLIYLSTWRVIGNT